MALILTTLAKVRSESGFTVNPDIEDTKDILPHANHSEGIVLSSVSQQYSLPLSGNANYIDSPAQYILEGVTTNLASALLLKKVYEGQGGSMIETADIKANTAMIQIDKIRTNELPLFGSDGVELARAYNRASGKPTTNVDLEKSRISVNDIF